MASDVPIDDIAILLAEAPGVEAIVLGGSRARGDFTASSDYDLGLYFRRGTPFSVEDLQQRVLRFVDQDSPVSLTPIGEWGPWIVGGGWLTVSGKPVDLLYRCLDDVEAIIDEVELGKIRVDYQPGHPHAFASPIWLAELHYCRLIVDRTGVIARLKDRLQPYPSALRLAILGLFQWEIGFAAANAAKAIRRGDRTYIAGAVFRSLACMAQVICALNGVYVMNEKGAIALAASQPVAPAALADRIDVIWERFGAADYEGALNILGELEREVGHLADRCRRSAD